MTTAELLLRLVFATLATFRTAEMVATEEGPFSVFSNLRGKLGQATWIGRGVHCKLCVGVWTALLFALFVGVADIGTFVIYWMGISGGAVVLTHWMNRR